MTDSEKRRRRLLEQTRALYSDYGDTPAVHPRYHSSYNRLYDSNEEVEISTFGIRFVVCLMLFAAFVMMDTQGQKIMEVDSNKIVQEITTDTDVAEVWRNL